MSPTKAKQKCLPDKVDYIPDPCWLFDTWNRSIKCPGCHRAFGNQIVGGFKYPCPSFFDHCRSKCTKYGQMELFRECDECWSFFIDEALYKSHLPICSVIAERNLIINNAPVIFDYSQDCKGPPEDAGETSGEESDMEETTNKEAWVLHIPQSSLECWRFRERIPCLGCGKEYPGVKIKERIIEDDGTEREEEAIVGRRDYYHHCIFKCSKYLALNLVTLCLRCNEYFLNPDEFVTHKMLSPSCNVEIVPEPENSDPKLKCTICSKMYKSLKSIRQHFTKSHPGEKKPVIIDPSQAGVDTHGDVADNADASDQPKFTCNLCPKSYFSIGGLRVHKKKCHPAQQSSSELPETVVKVEEDAEKKPQLPELVQNLESHVGDPMLLSENLKVVKEEAPTVAREEVPTGSSIITVKVEENAENPESQLSEAPETVSSAPEPLSSSHEIPSLLHILQNPLFTDPIVAAGPPSLLQLLLAPVVTDPLGAAGPPPLKMHNEQAEKYPCPYCPETFFVQASLYRHGRLAHGAQPTFTNPDPTNAMEVEAPVSKFICKKCSKSYSYKRSLSNHVKKFHPPTSLLEAVQRASPSMASSSMASLSIASSSMASSSMASSSLASSSQAFKTQEHTSLISKIVDELIQKSPVKMKAGSPAKTVEIPKTESPFSSASFTDEEMELIMDSFCKIKIDPDMFCLSPNSNQCRLCFVVFETYLLLKVHFLNTHFNNYADCTECDQSFPNVLNMAHHFAADHELAARTIIEKLKRNTSVKRSQDTHVMASTKQLKTSPEAASYAGQSSTSSNLSQLSIADDSVCLGCQQRFSNTQHISRFYSHCIFECQFYAELGLRRACKICRGLFMNQQLLDEHQHNFCQVIPLN